MRAASTSSPSAMSTIGGERARRDQQQRRQGRPFRMPGPGAALMILHLRRKDRRGEIGRHRGSAERARGRDGIALVRHGGRAAAAFAGRLESFADIGLHHQRDVARDLAAGAGKDREHRGGLRDAVAMGVPGRIRQRQLKLLRELLPRPQSPCRRALPACRRRRRTAAPAPRCATASAACASDAAPRHIRRASGRTASAAHAAARCARPPRCCDAVARALRSLQCARSMSAKQRVDGRAQHQHGRGVDHVLAGGAPMHIARGIGVGLGDCAVSALTRGMARLPERVAASASALRCRSIGLAGLRNRLGCEHAE